MWRWRRRWFLGIVQHIEQQHVIQRQFVVEHVEQQFVFIVQCVEQQCVIQRQFIVERVVQQQFVIEHGASAGLQ